jgi:hypothetical protein
MGNAPGSLDSSSEVASLRGLARRVQRPFVGGPWLSPGLRCLRMTGGGGGKFVAPPLNISCRNSPLPYFDWRRHRIFRLRSFFASRRSYCAQDDSVTGEMGAGCKWGRALRGLSRNRSRGGMAEAMPFQISRAAAPALRELEDRFGWSGGSRPRARPDPESAPTAVIKPFRDIRFT